MRTYITVLKIESVMIEVTPELDSKTAFEIVCKDFGLDMRRNTAEDNKNL